MRPLLALVLAAAGCGLNPAFIEPTGGTLTNVASGPATTTPDDPSTTTPPQTSQPDPDTTAAPDTTEPLTSDTSSDPTTPDDTTTTEPIDTTTTTTTTPDDTTTIDAACPGGCQPCEVCLGGACVTNANAPCNFPSNPNCGMQVWGLDMTTGKCLAYEDAAPTCVGPNQCEHVCQDPGLPIVDCGPQCYLDNNICVQGAPFASITDESVCAGPMDITSGCQSGCEPAMDNTFEFQVKACNADHVCEARGVIDCEYGVCSDAGGCKLMCQDSSDCIGGAVCDEVLDKCKPA